MTDTPPGPPSSHPREGTEDAPPSVTWGLVGEPPPGAGAGPESEPDAGPAAAPSSRRRRSRTLVATWVVVGLVLASLGGLSAYLFTVHSQYVSQNAQLRQEAAALGTQVAQARVTNEHQAAELATLETQLAQAKDRISSLANDAAQAGDDKLALVDVGASLVKCAEERQSLIGYLKQASLYTTASLRAREAQITTFCNDTAQVYASIVSGG